MRNKYDKTFSGSQLCQKPKYNLNLVAVKYSDFWSAQLTLHSSEIVPVYQPTQRQILVRVS
jgi:hypothetical protein